MKEKTNIIIKTLLEKIRVLEQRIKVLGEYSLLRGNKDIELLNFIERLKERKKRLESELKLSERF
jgi:hypothetical protein